MFGPPGTCTCTSPTACTGARTSWATSTGTRAPCCCGRVHPSPASRPCGRAGRRRAAERDLCSGPAKLAQALGHQRAPFDGADLVRGPVRILDDGVAPPRRPGGVAAHRPGRPAGATSSSGAIPSPATRTSAGSVVHRADVRRRAVPHAAARGTVECIREDDLRERLALGPAAPGEARDRPDRVRPPPRFRGRPAQAPAVPGPRAHRRAHHRRLHRPRRRPERALGDPAPAVDGARSTSTLATYLEQVAAHPRLRRRPHRGPPQLRVARRPRHGPRSSS